MFKVLPKLAAVVVVILMVFVSHSLGSKQSNASANNQLKVGGVSEQVPDSCPVTKPPVQPFVPPSPYPTELHANSFWFGTEKLWTSIPANGTWKGLPHYTSTDTAFRNKLFWWREGYDWRINSEPKLIITGNRLDSPAPPLRTDEHANAGWGKDKDHAFIVDGIFIPTLGCWKITGRLEEAELTYVIWVSQ